MTSESTVNWYLHARDDGRELANALLGQVRSLQETFTAVSVQNVRNLRMYENRESSGMVVAAYTLNQAASSIANPRGTRVTWNIIRSVTDTIVSKLSKNRIAPTFLTQNAPYKLQREAKKLTQWSKGFFYDSEAHIKNPLVLRDGCIFGKGAAYVYAEKNETKKTARICVERVLPDEILVDPNDSYYGKPSMLYRIRLVPKLKLRAMFKSRKSDIDACTVQKILYGVNYVDCCMVVEAWKLPDVPDATEEEQKGRHVLAIDNCALVDEEYTDDEFPFAFFDYTAPVVGFHGTGVCDNLMGVQLEINRLLLHIQQSQRLLANPRVFLETGSKVNTNQLTNEIGGIVHYTGQPPVIQAAQTVTPDIFNQLNQLWQRGYEIEGVSQLSATSKNVLGANASGQAFREYADIETERFSLTANAYQDLHLQEAKIAIRLARKLSKDGYEVPQTAFSRKEGADRINFSEIDLEEDAYVMQMFPASALPSQPFARYQTISEMRQAGDIDPDTALELMDMPDLDNATRLKTAPIRWLHKKIERMMETEVYDPPEPYDNHQLALKLALSYYEDAKEREANENLLDLLRQFMVDCDAEIKKATQPAAPPAVSPAQQLLESQLAAAPAAQAVPGQALPPTF